MRTILVMLCAGALALGACKKKDADKAPAKTEEPKAPDKNITPVKPADPVGSGAAPAPAKPTKDDCEKVAQHQIDIETDASMKSAMQASKPGLIDSCLSLNKAQADCMLTAKDGPGFADCITKNP
jgi:hypothetical protein